MEGLLLFLLFLSGKLGTPELRLLSSTSASRQKYRAPNDVNSKATAFGSELGASAKVNLRLSCPWGISLGPSCHKERGLLAFYFIFLKEIVCIIYIK